MKKLIIVAAILTLSLLGRQLFANETRVRAGLQVLFDFRNVESNRIVDQSGMGRPVVLRVESPKSVELSNGSIHFQGKSVVRSETRADKIHRACEWTNELTVEAWLKPADTKQKGPARIVTFSRNGSQRNFTLGQEGDKFDFRLRTNRTSVNGTPSLSSPGGSVKTKLTHVVYTRARNGRARMYVDGKQVAETVVPGEFSNWDINFRLLIGNEQSDDRTWKGKIHLVAIYNRALGPSEVHHNFSLGVDGKTNPVSMIKNAHDDAFRKSIAPIFALHCLECHDSAQKEGGLNLSLRSTAFEGESGTVIEKGKASESLLWESLASDDMPKDRPPLKKSEKEAIKKWIDAGANWTVERIDPAVFLRSREVDAKLVRRLTVEEYIDSVKTAVDVDIREEAQQALPKDLRADGFANTAYNLNVDLKHIEIYAKLAGKIAKQIDVVKFAQRFHSRNLNDKKFGANDLQSLVSKSAVWVLRGPLDEVEKVSLLNVAQSIRAVGGSFEDAFRGTLQAMLQSPRFLYQIEQQRGDGTLWPVDSFTRANRASFIVWGSPPDQELFNLAVSGQLANDSIFKQQIERLLKHPKAIKRSQEFVSQWLHLDRLDSMKPNGKKFPDWDPSLADQMKEETVRFWTEIVWNRKLPLKSLFDAEVTFVTPELARHYGISKDSLGKQTLKTGWNKIELQSIPGRRGILTHGSVLTVGGDEASMVSRGLFILDDVLRGVVNDPPACVDTTPTPTQAGLTQRSIALARIKNNNCGGCHMRFEPLAFGFEKFDGLGRYQVKDEHGNGLREDGEIRFPGDDKVIQYKTSKELAALVAGNERTLETMTWKLVQFSMGRPMGPNDIDVIESIHEKTKQGGGTYHSLMHAILTSDLVLKIKSEPYPKEP